VHGNVYEWCEDIWHDSYNGAPVDGSAWLQGGDVSGRLVLGGPYRVRRGGSWDSNPLVLRSARRDRGPTGLWDDHIGFRLGRAYILNLYLFTFWGPGAKPLVEFFWSCFDESTAPSARTRRTINSLT
jgi:hypothetical protein